MAASWTGSPTDRYDLYLQRCKELLARRLIRSEGLQPQLQIRFHRNEGLRMTTSQPDEEDLRSFLMSLRLFLSNDEPTNVGLIRNRLYQDVESDVVRGRLAEAYDQWRRACREGAVALQVDAERFDSEDLYDWWISGVYFHSDDRKRTRLQTLNPAVAVISRFKLLDHLAVATGYVAFLGNTILWTRREGLLRF